MLDTTKIPDEAINPVSGSLVRLSIVGFVTKQLVSPSWHVALAGELVVRRLPVDDLKDFGIGKSASVLDCNHRQIWHPHGQIGPHDAVPTGIRAVAGFAEVSKQRRPCFEALLMAFLRTRA